MYSRAGAPRAVMTLALLAGLSGCGSSDTSTPPTPAALLDAEAQIVALLDDYRQDAGLPTLVRDEALDAVARSWSDRLSALGEPSHNPAYAAQIPAGWTSSGENIGWADPAVHPLAGLPTALNQGWIDSPSHRANMDDPDYTAVGVGVAYSGDGVYITADFAAYP